MWRLAKDALSCGVLGPAWAGARLHVVIPRARVGSLPGCIAYRRSRAGVDRVHICTLLSSKALPCRFVAVTAWMNTAMARRGRLAGRAQVRELAAYLEGRAAEAAGRLAYERAVVTRVAPLGMGDRRAQRRSSFP